MAPFGYYVRRLRDCFGVGRTAPRELLRTLLITETNVMKISRGFSLLELLIVVAIILIIATIAIPSLLRSQQGDSFA